MILTYDHLGLIRPSARTGSGHRLYQEADVQRLYQVLALRQLGLSSETAAQVLSGSVSMRRLRAQIATLTTIAADGPRAWPSCG